MLERRAAINATEGAPKTFDSYSNGISDWSYESFDSWVRFDFDATTLSGGKLWAAARGYASKTACEGGPDGETDLMSNDPSIVPPLSAAELSYQCNGTKPPCKLHWYPGKNCYTIEDVPFASGTPGYLQRAKKLGYRTVAAASGTTANILQYALMLGFTAEEMVLVRLTMAAWMLCTNDHSLYEIMLGAAPYMPPVRPSLPAPAPALAVLAGCACQQCLPAPAPAAAAAAAPAPAAAPAVAPAQRLRGSGAQRRQGLRGCSEGRRGA